MPKVELSYVVKGANAELVLFCEGAELVLFCEGALGICAVAIC
jgi:hypothetical protein